jgi:CRP-like cAMP-binding protein
MEKIYQVEQIAAAVAQSKYRDMLESLPIRPFLVRYEVGELVAAPDQRTKLFLIVTEGALSIYFVRDDGSSYSLSYAQKDGILGETDVFEVENQGIFAEVTEPLTCLAITIEDNRDTLLSSAPFLHVLSESLARKMETLTMKDAAQPSLRERTLAYMRYKCEAGRLKGVESAAFQLHCSSRQLQRILNVLEREQLVQKIGKGAYSLKSK